MKPTGSSIFSRIIFLIAGILAGLGVLFMFITYIVATNYHEASTQLLDKDVAAHIAKFSTPFGDNGLDKQKADSVFFDAMVLSPNSEVYFLDTTGKVTGYHRSEFGIRQWQVSLDKINAYIGSEGKKYIKGTDPRDPQRTKIFSAAAVKNKGELVGYIYIILTGTQSRIAADSLFSNHIILLSLLAFVIVFIVSLLFSLWYVRRIQKRFDRVIDVLHHFEEGDFNARFDIKKQDGLSAVKNTFNKMADLLVYHINKLTKSEGDRKTFITGITHDLRNPLAIASGYAETLVIKGEQHVLTRSQQQEYAQLILQKVQLVERLVIQLHELSSMESVSSAPKLEPFMFSELVQEVAHSFRQKAEERSLSIRCEGCEDDAYVLADVSLMERVIQNLLSNAVANAPVSTPIVISLTKQQGMLSCAVENTGIELSPQMIQWLMDGEDSMQTVKPYQAALGLSIVKRILNAHQFPLSVSCHNNQIVFQFRMPVYRTRISD